MFINSNIIMNQGKIRGFLLVNLKFLEIIYASDIFPSNDYYNSNSKTNKKIYNSDNLICRNSVQG